VNRPELAQFFSLMRRHPFGAVCIALSVVAVGVSWFLWQQVDELEAAHYVRSQEGESMLTTQVGGPLLRQELAFVRSYTRRIEDHLVTEENQSENYSYFYAIEEQSKARITELRQRSAPPPDGGAQYKRIPYSVKVTGTYAQVAAFLQAVETGPRLSSITAFSFRRQAPASSMLTLDLSLVLLGKL
jgi:Tfp pilus assembly protein PilO